MRAWRQTRPAQDSVAVSCFTTVTAPPHLFYCMNLMRAYEFKNNQSTLPRLTSLCILAHLMDNRFVHREIRRTLQNGGLQSATIWSDRQNNMADQCLRFCEVNAKYKDLYNSEIELKWEQRESPLMQQFDERAKLARSLPIGLLSQWTGETNRRAWTWDFLNENFDKLKAPSRTVDRR